MYKEFKQKLNFQKRSFLIIIISLLCFFLGQIISSLIIQNFDPNLYHNILSQAELTNKELNILKTAQFFSAFLSFVLPSILCGILLFTNWKSQLKISKLNYKSSYFLIPLFLLLIMPFMNIIIHWNENIVFPQAFNQLETSLKASENSSKLLLNTLLSGSGINILIVNILLIAVLPAIGEELFFRGLLQSHLNDYFKNPHIGIFISAFLFSAIHFQFYGFFPRLILGLIFGYLVFYSGSILSSIIAHFFNNVLAVIIVYFQNLGKLNQEIESFGYSKNEIIYTLLSLVFAIFIARILIINFQNQNKIANLGK